MSRSQTLSVENLLYETPNFLPAGDQAIVVELGDAIDPKINRRVHDLVRAIEGQDVPGVVDLLPTYRSLLVQYDPMQVSYSDLQDRLAEIERDLGESTAGASRTVQIPTLYQGEHAPDLQFVAEHAGLTTDEVIELHSGTDYLVYMMGFTAGFPYLGGLSERLITPRLDTPRAEIPAGSVGIAESQTGVYPVSSPGGWRLIGRTPVKMFDARRDAPSLLAAGDFVRFVPLPDDGEYRRILELVEADEYEPTVEQMQ